MLSELHIESQNLDASMIEKHLQLKGEVGSDGWRFPIGASAGTKSVERQLGHWCTVLARKKEGRRLLARNGYTFTIRVIASNETRVALPLDVIDALVRQGLGLEIVYRAPSNEDIAQ